MDAPLHKVDLSDNCLVVVLAHPDDESFGMGGTLAWYASKGVKVRLICATYGEAGEVDPALLKNYSSVGALREHELRCAAKYLNLTSVDFLGYRDSGMAGSSENQHAQALIRAPIEEVASEIVYFFRKYKPQVVLTFDPSGGYHHPDHIAVHQATEKAFYLTGDDKVRIKGTSPFQPDKLYFHTMPSTFIKILVKIMPLFAINPHQFGKNKDIDLTLMSNQNFPIHARINYHPVANLRDQAAACHASQGGAQTSGFALTWIRRLLSSTDTFMRAYPQPMQGRIEKDLFEGVAK